MSKKMITVQDVADVLDHSLLRPDITVEALKEGCELAKKYQTISVCVRPSDLPIVCQELKGTKVLPTTVIGFPHGTCTTETKVFETKDAIAKGASTAALFQIGAREKIGRAKSVEVEEYKEAYAAMSAEMETEIAEIAAKGGDEA
mgnify:CR=1 FL=1